METKTIISEQPEILSVEKSQTTNIFFRRKATQDRVR